MNFLKDKRYKNLINNLKEKESVIAVVVFGSYARNNYNVNSDIDICIITDKFISNADFDYPDKDEGFDIHLFHSLPFEIQFKIFSEGKVIFINDEKKYNLIRKRTIREHRGFEYRKNIYDKMLLERY